MITNINDLKLPDRDICLVVRDPSKKVFLSEAANDTLKSAEKSWSFHNMDLYLLKQETLMGVSQ